MQVRIKISYMPLLTLEELQEKVPVFRGGFGGRMARVLMRWLKVDKVNGLYDRNASVSGADFARVVLWDIGMDYEIIHPERLRELPPGPFVVIANHPYGSLDGVMLVDIFGHIRPDFKVMVNGFLSRVEALDGNFIKVTPTGDRRTAPTAESLQGVRAAMEHVREGHPLAIFPSGAVSDLSLRDRCVRDRQWQEAAVRLVRKLSVPVVPVHFLDGNSTFYYLLGLIDWRVRLLRLPSEVFNKNGVKARVAIGKPILPDVQQQFHDTASFGAFLRKSVMIL